MATLTSQTVLTIADASAVTVSTDLIVQPENTGTLALRELTYPLNVFAPIVYDNNPDSWTNFDSSPMTTRPTVSRTPTIEGNRLTGWFGYDRDKTIVETWRGSDSEASMSLTFFRQLYAYFSNPPSDAFIQWSPKDRTTEVYNIMINSLTAGGQDVQFNFIAALNNCMLGDVVLTFTIVSQV